MSCTNNLEIRVMEAETRIAALEMHALKITEEMITLIKSLRGAYGKDE